MKRKISFNRHSFQVWSPWMRTTLVDTYMFLYAVIEEHYRENFRKNVFILETTTSTPKLISFKAFICLRGNVHSFPSHYRKLLKCRRKYNVNVHSGFHLLGCFVSGRVVRCWWCALSYTCIHYQNRISIYVRICIDVNLRTGWIHNYWT